MIKNKIYLICLSGWILFSCTTKESLLSSNDYLKWLAREENGLTKKKVINNLELKVQYIPNEFLSLQELRKNNMVETRKNFDSLYKTYCNGESYVISVKSKEVNTSGSLIYTGIADEVDYKERIHMLSFRMQEFISLKRDNHELVPVLVNYDGQNELAKEIKFLAVFKKEKNKPITDVELVFDDPFWSMGINHFTFSKEEIESIPQLKID